MIPVSRPSIGKEELAAVEKVFQSGWLGLGSTVKEFEDRIASFLEADNVIAVNTGTSALHLALDAIGLKEGDEVIVPAMTFVASIQAITATGAVPVFCDVELDTMNIDIGDVKRKLSKNTKAIMPVHYRGQACDIDGLLDMARGRSLRVVEDAAHAFGCRYKGRMIGGFGDISCFSFDPIKNITCGEGGAVVTADKELTEIMQRKRILGIDKDTWSRYRNERSWFYDVLTRGYRYHMSNINAAIGIEQIKKFDRFKKKRRDVARLYDEAFKGLKGLSILPTDHDSTVLFTYIVRVLDGKREKMMDFLKQKGVGSGIHYIPANRFTLYKEYASKLPNTAKLYDEILTLPLYCDMTDNDISLVIKSVKEFFGAA